MEFAPGKSLLRTVHIRIYISKDFDQLDTPFVRLPPVSLTNYSSFRLILLMFFTPFSGNLCSSLSFLGAAVFFFALLAASFVLFAFPVDMLAAVLEEKTIGVELPLWVEATWSFHRGLGGRVCRHVITILVELEHLLALYVAFLYRFRSIMSLMLAVMDGGIIHYRKTGKLTL